MIEIKIQACDVLNRPPKPPMVFFKIDREDLNEFSSLIDKDLSGYILTVKKQKQKSRNMHNYMWILCDKIAKKKVGFMTWSKEDVYRLAVRQVGQWYDITLAKEDTQAAITDWCRNGTGWFAENIFSTEETSTIRFYRGASVYTADELYTLTDYVVEMAKELNIDTVTEAELNRLKELWG